MKFGQKQGQEYLFWCDFCPDMHHRPKLSINFQKGKYKCWICEARGNNLYYLVKKFGTFSVQQQWLEITNQEDITDFEVIFFGKQEKQKIETKVELPKEFVSLSKLKGPEYVQAQQYLIGRGLTRYDIIRWRIGCCLSGYYKDRIIFPSFDENGSLNYFVARTFKKSGFPTYKNPKISKNIVFCELDLDWRKDVLLVEGVFDFWDKENCVPLLGSSLTQKSVLLDKMAENGTCVYVALDKDAKHKTLKMLQLFLSYGLCVYLVDTRGFKDVGEIPKNIFDKRKKQAEFITPDNIVTLFSIMNI